MASKPGWLSCLALTLTAIDGRWSVGLQGGAPENGGVQHPVVQGHDEAALLGERDERVRGQQASLGVVPPHQGLEPADRVRVQGHDRLVDQGQLIGRDGDLELLAHGERLDGVAVPGRVVDRQAALAALLGHVHGHVRVAHRVRSVGPPGHRLGQPDAGPDDVQVPVDLDGRGEGGEQAVRHLGRGGQVRVLHEDGELVTAQPRGRVLVAQGSREPLGDGEQDDVAARVAEAVVDVLEVVEVEGEDRQRAPRLRLAAGQGVVDAVEEQLPVRQPGQGVVEGLGRQVLLQPLALGDVADGEHPSPDGRVVAQVDQAALHHQLASVAAAHPELERVHVAAGPGQQPGQHRLVLGGHDLEQRSSGQLLG